MHKAHRMTPAMAAGVTGKLWSMTDVAEMLTRRCRWAARVVLTRKKIQTETLPGEGKRYLVGTGLSPR